MTDIYNRYIALLAKIEVGEDYKVNKFSFFDNYDEINDHL